MDGLVIPPFLARTACEPFIWGQNDCATWAAALVAEATGKDLAAGFRGTYDTAFGCRRVIMQHGGLLELSRKMMSGFPSGEQENGVCVAKVRGRTMCGVLSGGRLFVKTENGLFCPAEFTILDGWSLTCRRH
ncbi:DUF6950 family protein [Defluviimonas aestuarii]|uniref:DUF6950 family protein n=1 Tax=Albidovulum aestuarii TaxID=1130726 RepID=UPI003B0033FF